MKEGGMRRETRDRVIKELEERRTEKRRGEEGSEEPISMTSWGDIETSEWRRAF